MPDEIHVNDPFTANVPYSASAVKPVNSIRLYKDDVLHEERMTTVTTAPGSVDFPFPTGLARGTYNFRATAVNPEGESPQSAVSTLVIVGLLPDAPGTITFRFGV